MELTEDDGGWRVLWRNFSWELVCYLGVKVENKDWEARILEDHLCGFLPKIMATVVMENDRSQKPRPSQNGGELVQSDFVWFKAQSFTEEERRDNGQDMVKRRNKDTHPTCKLCVLRNVGRKQPPLERPGQGVVSSGDSHVMVRKGRWKEHSERRPRI